jgi:uncharacterized SAM-binding protein YcdF (DUF218 family)
VTQHDAIIILGSQPDPTTWEVPKQIYHCLDRTLTLLQAEQAPLAITSGKWSIALENQGIKQPFRECDVMADYLISKGLPASKVLREGRSKDAISNLYYLKKDFLLPRDMRRLLFVIAEFRIPRLKFLCNRVLGDGYKVDFDSIPSPPGPSYDEPRTFKRQKEFLAPMNDGDHNWLDDKFYDAPMYRS